jgi:hypothetical protein
MQIDEWKVEKAIENLKDISQIIRQSYDDSRYIQERIWECVGLLEKSAPEKKQGAQKRGRDQDYGR